MKGEGREHNIKIEEGVGGRKSDIKIEEWGKGEKAINIHKGNGGMSEKVI